MKSSIGILGGGIAGLATAHTLCRSQPYKEGAFTVALLEKDARAGGIIDTLHEKDCIIENGPDSFITVKPGALELCRDLKIEDRLIATNNKFRRAFVADRNKLHAVPSGFEMIAPKLLLPFLSSSLFSLSGKARILLERFVPGKSNGDDESVASFVRRRLGKEALAKAAQPLLAGIYMADADTLSLAATMPRFLEMERKYGSVISGLRAQGAGAGVYHPPGSSPIAEPADASGARYGAFAGFDSGMSVLVDELVKQLPAGVVSLNCDALSIVRKEDQWLVQLTNGVRATFDILVLAVPAFVAAQLLMDADRRLSSTLAQIQYASSVVLNLLFPRHCIRHDLDGFGFVVPISEKKQIVAASFSNVKFPNRCSQDQALIRVFMGGALSPRLTCENEEDLLAYALKDLNTYLGIRGTPDKIWLKRWLQAMPQYNIGHASLIEEIEKQVASCSNLFLAGAYAGGVGIPDCIASGQFAARKILTMSNCLSESLSR